MAALIFLTFRVIRLRNEVERGLLFVSIFLGPIVIVLLGNIGRNDVFLLTGSVLVALSLPIGNTGHVVPSKRAGGISFFGIFLMLIGNPEQSVVAFLLLLLISFSSNFRSIRNCAAFGLAISLTTCALLTIWASAFSVGSRFGLVDDFYRQSIQNFLTNFSLVIFSGYGFIWIAVILVILWSKMRDLPWVVLSTVMVPVVVVGLTADQTRVWVGITAAVSLVLVRFLAMRIPADHKYLVLGSTFVVALFAPTLEVTYAGEVRSPLQYIYFVLINRMTN